MDELARLRAESEQTRETLKETAQNLWAFYNEATSKGFKEEQALQLTEVMFRELMRSSTTTSVMDDLLGLFRQQLGEGPDA